MNVRETEYRRALDVALTRYETMADPDLTAFLAEFRGCLHSHPLEKLNRWLGYVQGVLIERGRTTVQEERDWTRPLFRPLDFRETVAEREHDET